MQEQLDTLRTNIGLADNLQKHIHTNNINHLKKIQYRNKRKYTFRLATARLFTPL